MNTQDPKGFGQNNLIVEHGNDEIAEKCLHQLKEIKLHHLNPLLNFSNEGLYNLIIFQCLCAFAV